MLVCKKCKSPLQLKTNHKVLSGYFINFSGIIRTELEIVEPEQIEFAFYCPVCDEETQEDNIETKCYLCSKYIPLDQAVVIQSRGNYHKECAEEYFKDEPTNNLIDLIKKEGKPENERERY